MPTITRTCPKCNVERNIDRFTYYKGNGGDHYRFCKSCERKTWNECEPKLPSTDPRMDLYNRSKLNAMNEGICHEISPEDIPLPNVCKYTGAVLEYKEVGDTKGRRWRSNLASLDRIDSSLGYVKGNIQVISFLANRMKQDSTLEEMIAFARGVIRVHCPDE